MKRERGGRGTDSVEFLSVASGEVATGTHGIEREFEGPVSQLATWCPRSDLDLVAASDRGHGGT